MSLSPYNYANNCPLYYVDPDGKMIDPFNMMMRDFENYKKLINELQYITGLNLFVNDEGYLDYEKDKKGNAIYFGGSKSARKLLIGILKDPNVVRLYSQTGNGSQGGGDVLVLDPKQIEAFVNGTSKDLNKMTMSWAMVFFHEARHTNAGGNYEDPKNHLIAGDIEEPINDAREELGENWGRRMTYQGTIIGDEAYIPFSPYANEKIIKNGQQYNFECIHFSKRFNPK